MQLEKSQVCIALLSGLIYKSYVLEMKRSRMSMLRQLSLELRFDPKGLT